MRPTRSQGQTIAAILSGAWRTDPSPLSLSPEVLPAALPLLQETGAGSLAYWRLSRAGLGSLPCVRGLRQTYRLHTLETAILRDQLYELLRRFRTAGIDPLIVKGWSVSRLYPETGLRPHGDIDVCVRPEEQAVAGVVLADAAGRCGLVDLHAGVADLEDRRLDEVYRRSRLVPLRDGEVRILSAEDQLRHLGLHFMRHGAWRPLWLCDVAVALESLPAGFDWDYCRSGDRRLTEWMDCAAALAARLLDAQVPPAAGHSALPRWLAPAVLHAWQQGADANDAVAEPFADCLRSLAALPGSLRRRWPNPIRAAFTMRVSPFAPLPRVLTQFTAFSLRAWGYLSHELGPRQELPAGPFTRHPARIR